MSCVTGLSLLEYITALDAHCSATHAKPCSMCNGLSMVGKSVLEEGYCSLSEAFRLASPRVKYTAERARRKFLQMPLVAIRIGDPTRGQSFSILMEMFPGIDYSKMGMILNGLTISQTEPRGGKLEKSVVKMLLGIAQSDRERMCVRYAIYKSSGMTPTAARRKYGFSNIADHAKEVEDALSKIQNIRESISELAAVEDEALMQSFGINTSSTESDEEDTAEDSAEEGTSTQEPLITHDLKEMLCRCHFNWFQFMESLPGPKQQEFSSVPPQLMLELFDNCSFDEQEMLLLRQSYLAFCAAEGDAYGQKRMARIVNGEVVSESESDSPESYVHIVDPLCTAGKKLIAKKRATIRRRARRKKEKEIAEQRFLARRVSKRASNLLQKFPDIGETIETFVQDHQVGADAWRRTGVLTFDGNAKLKEKVTYEKIRQHLQDKYHHRFSYGKIIQLCVPRNRRRSSAKRYMGVAKVTSRRARKGFNLRLNPDDHWSAAFYKGLNQLQYVDGTDMINMNRDDSTGFRLDTLTTCTQYKSPVVQGQQVLTTRTDYVNKHPSVLQTTSYNFSKTSTTGEVCVGVVKAAPLHDKNPAQHVADLCMLESKEELKPIFFNMHTGHPKSIECIRVDGASDEGPVHTEVQYWWTQQHVRKERLATFVTTRSSGSSYLNRVELQNGCLSLGHSNTFIPSTLAGSCTDPETGALNISTLKENLSLAITAYISRVDGCPCGDTCIKLYRGVDSTTSSEHLSVRPQLLTFLKGSKVAKQKLRQDNPEMYAEFQLVWDIRQRHLVHDLPAQYIFLLVCCFEHDCPHPVCRRGKPSRIPSWYKGGPPITHIPLPVVDQSRPWGNQSCSTCQEFCAGHYKYEFIDTKDKGALSMCIPPPSIVLKSEFLKLEEYPPSQDLISDLAKKVLLTPEVTRLWLDHLHTVLLNRKRGAKKAADTRAKARMAVGTLPTSSAGVTPQSESTTAAMAESSTPPSVAEDTESYYCGTCGKEYNEEGDREGFWIGCDVCDCWYCSVCENLKVPPLIDIYLCIKCRQ